MEKCFIFYYPAVFIGPFLCVKLEGTKERRKEGGREREERKEERKKEGRKEKKERKKERKKRERDYRHGKKLRIKQPK